MALGEDVAICDTLYRMLQYAEDEDITKEHMLVCSQVAVLFRTAKEQHVDIRIRMNIGTAATEIITAVHASWVEFAEIVSKKKMGQRWAKTFKKMFGSPLSVIDLAQVDGKVVELWIGDMKFMGLSCWICDTGYSTTVNAQRCGHAHDKDPIPDKAGLIKRTWDAMTGEQREKLLWRLRKVAKNYQGPVIDIIMWPEHMTGEEVVDILQETSEGVFDKCSHREAPVADLLTFQDQLALLSYHIEVAIVGQSSYETKEGTVTNSKPSAQSIKRFVKKYAPKDPAEKLVFMEYLESTDYDYEKVKAKFYPVEVPVVEVPVVEVPVVEVPVVETPVFETPVVETPVVETPVVETPVVEVPAVETPVISETVCGLPVESPVESPVIYETICGLPVVGPVQTPVIWGIPVESSPVQDELKGDYWSHGEVPENAIWQLPVCIEWQSYIAQWEPLIVQWQPVAIHWQHPPYHVTPLFV